jgi:hypothetical protein
MRKSRSPRGAKLGGARAVVPHACLGRDSARPFSIHLVGKKIANRSTEQDFDR